MYGFTQEDLYNERFDTLEKEMKELLDDIDYWQRIRDEHAVHEGLSKKVLDNKKNRLKEVLVMLESI